MTVKILVFNTSPHMDKGNTALILNPFLDGMKESGAEVETVYTKKLKIGPCLGCFNCWLRTPGVCAQKDDMTAVLDKMRNVDIYVFATPVYFFNMSGWMKNLIDRMCPLFESIMELRDGHCYQRLRDGYGGGKVVLVSNCGWWEADNFDPLVEYMQKLCDIMSWEYAGALVRPHGPALSAMLSMGAPVNDIFDAAREAGRQLVQNGEMSADTLATVSRELMPQDMYIQVANQEHQKELDKRKK